MYSLYSCWLHMLWNSHFQEKFTFNDLMNKNGKKNIYVERF